LIFGVAFGFDG